ncbi:hypothetical protein [Actinokineospora sp. UTMC 2448]|uniref:hypothetical protein n=1 Tax=Actinokineospora sp. UTMC 2448 TaxID=2268449 RepID=UPI002164D266|nr:hypothetical protein [Actinokineospora sp. UTMC 2448]UVS80553.1 hypothetical protein Actkin_04304 [Actinokineospora sp. UTMC 2448]
MNDPSVADRLLELASQARVPDVLTEAGREARFGEPRSVQVQRGQVWRASWDDVSLLVLLLDVGDFDVTMAPVTLDPPAEDEHCLVLEPRGTAFGVPVTVWRGLQAELPVRVLDAVLDQWADELVNAADQRLEADAGLPPRSRRGTPILSEFDQAATVRAEILDDLDALRASPALPIESEGRSTPSLVNVLADKFNFEGLMTALIPLGLTQAEVMDIVRGYKPMTPAQALAVSESTGVDHELVSQAVRPLPADLVAKVQHPRFRAVWREHAARDNTDEAAAREAGAYGVLAMAARQTGSGPPDWSRRIEQYLLGSRSEEQ